MQAVGVQLKSFVGFDSVEAVTCDGQLAACEVDANLVCATRDGLAFYEVVVGVDGFYVIK